MNIDFKAVADHCVNVVKTQYFCFTGRTGVKAYWTYMIPVIIISCLPLVGQLAALALLCPTLGMNARRLHDMGKSGWLQLICIVPVIGFIVLLYLCYQPGDPAANAFGEPDDN